MNHSPDKVTVPVGGHDLLTGETMTPPLHLPAGGCAVLRQEV